MYKIYVSKINVTLCIKIYHGETKILHICCILEYMSL